MTHAATSAPSAPAAAGHAAAAVQRAGTPPTLSGCCPFGRLTPELLREVTDRLHLNDVATGLKLVSKGNATALRADFSTVKLASVKTTDPTDLLTVYYHRVLDDHPNALFPGDDKQVYTVQQPWPGPGFVAHWGRPEPWRALSLPRRRRLLCLAASSLHAPSLEAALTHSQVGLSSVVLESAAAAGDLAACRRLVAEGCDLCGLALRAAAHGGHLHLLRWLMSPQQQHQHQHQQRPRPFRGWESQDLIALGACAGGQEGVLEWLEAGMPPPPAEAAVLQVSAAQRQQQGQQQPQEEQGQAAASAAAAATDAAGGSRGAYAGDAPATGATGAAGAPPAAGGAGPGAPPKPFVPKRVAFMHMVHLAALFGHGRLLQRLLTLGGYYDDRTWGLRSLSITWILGEVLQGRCGLDVATSVYALWMPRVLVELIRVGYPRGVEIGGELAAGAARSPTDWRDKLELLLQDWESPEEERDAEGGEEPQAEVGGGQGAAARRAAVQSVLQEPVLLEMPFGLAGEQPDCLERLRYLQARGMRRAWRTLETAQSCAEAGNTAALAELLGRLRLAVVEVRELMSAAAHNGHVPVLRLLVQRYDWRSLSVPLVLVRAVYGVNDTECIHLDVVRYLAEECKELEEERAQAGFGGMPWELRARAHQAWSGAFRLAASCGADGALLRLLHERHGAEVDLPYVAMGGSLESLEWALGVEAAQDQDTTFSAEELWQIAGAGNLAAAHFILDHGLLAPSAPGGGLPHPADHLPGVDFMLRGPAEEQADDLLNAVMNCLRLWVERRQQQQQLQAGPAAAAGASDSVGSSSATAGWDRLLAVAETFGLPPHQVAWLETWRQ
ncbi:hypothetical protein HYH02_003624 [Chlamydomonas schloesseri]|uniref:Uncharacterized protein n=1 Tax=Chlamydomonas schloesseri TaxID=2026947 RepID=A0A835WR60_9CHLO|nr:hypothetical protein HYH02_003624 [Chlamydomonas schloesseri]|eukprot:KAG2451848.1 hypothetical protein HYH02_003624 [Chlamydomonas schloesseri]